MRTRSLEFLSKSDASQFQSHQQRWTTLVAGGCEHIHTLRYDRAYYSFSTTVVRPLRESWVRLYADKLQRVVSSLVEHTLITNIMLFICDVFPWLYLQIATMNEADALDWMAQIFNDADVARRLHRQLSAANWDSDRQAIIRVNEQNRSIFEDISETKFTWMSHLQLLTGIDPSLDTITALTQGLQLITKPQGTDLLAGLVRNIYQTDLRLIDQAAGRPHATLLLLLTTRERLAQQRQLELLQLARSDTPEAHVPVIIDANVLPMEEISEHPNTESIVQ